MSTTVSVLALAFCFIAVASRSPAEPVIFIATIVLAVIADAIARTRTKPGLVSSPPPQVPLSSSSFSSSSISSSCLSSIPTPSVINPQVFLSFRGPNPRKGFGDCLYTNLIREGINAFRVNEDIPPTEKIDDALLESIKQCKISIPIISKDYASSRSCLMELAQMLECEKENNQLIVPIFYDINPTDLKRQQGFIEQFFHEHEKGGVDCTDIAKWRQALREIAKKKGYDLPITYNGYQGALIEVVVGHILKSLNKNDFCLPDGLVGIEHHVQEVMKKLGVVYADEKATGVDHGNVRVVGICGMPGVGKTTIAKVVYNKIRHLFERCIFLLDITKTVESNGVERLLEKFISNLPKKQWEGLSSGQCVEVIKDSFSKMKVLIFLDDVQDFAHVRHLVDKISWFGQGSRILMTIRSKAVLSGYGHGVADTYEVEPMSPCHSLELFCKNSFCGYPPEEEKNEYDSLSIDITDIIDGHPFSIEVTASFLKSSSWDIRIWQETSDFLRKKLEEPVKSAFYPSYDSLDEDTQDVFLDIACFCCGMEQSIPKYMWDADNNYSSRGIKILSDMCLISIGGNNEFLMHNQLRKFGKEIGRIKDSKRPRKCIRLCDHKDALSTLKGNEKATNVEVLCLPLDEGRSECLRSESFGHLSSVRVLGLGHATIEGSSQNVFPNLRWLQWQGCRQISELLIFHLENLVILDLSCSLVKGDSQEWEPVLEKAKNLEVLILRSCPHQHATLDFLTSKSLKRLDW